MMRSLRPARMRRLPVCAAALAACALLHAGCVAGGDAAAPQPSGEGPVLLSGQIFAPAAPGAAGGRAPAPLSAASVAYGGLSATTDARGRFTLESPSFPSGLRDLSVRDGGRFELHHALVARPREQLFLLLQYDAGSGRLYATECRLDCTGTGNAAARATVRSGIATAQGALAAEIAQAPSREIAPGATQAEVRDALAARMLAALADAQRIEGISLVSDPTELLASADLKFRPYAKTLLLAPAELDLSAGATAPLEGSLLRTDGSVAALPAGFAASSTAPAVALFDGRVVTALTPGQAQVSLSWNGLASNPVTVRVTDPAAPAAAPCPRDGRSL